MKRSQILDKSPKVQNLKNTTNREQPGQNEATKLEALYKIYPDVKPAEDKSTRPQPSEGIYKCELLMNERFHQNVTSQAEK